MPAYTRDTRNEGENYQFSSHDGTRAVSRKSRLDYSQPVVLKNFTQLSVEPEFQILLREQMRVSEVCRERKAKWSVDVHLFSVQM